MKKCTIEIKRVRKELSLPFTIGTSLDDTIYLNSNRYSESYFYVFEANNRLCCQKKDGTTISSSYLYKKFDINLLGLFTEEDSPLIQLKYRIFQLEDKIPPSIKNFLLYSYSAKKRLIYIIFLLLSVLITSQNALKINAHKESTKSNVIQKLEDGIENKSIFKKQYRYGVVFNSNLNKNNSSLPALLSFKIIGLEHDGSLIVKVNKKILFVSKREESCIKRVCEKRIVVNPDQTKEGLNTVSFIHSRHKEPWALGFVKIETYRPANQVEKTQIQLWLASAKEKYNERHVSPYSAILAKKFMIKIDKILENKYVSREQNLIILALKKEINSFVKRFTDNFWSEHYEYIRLEQYNKALNHLIEMHAFFPDTESHQGQKISQKIQYVKSLLGVSDDD